MNSTLTADQILNKLKAQKKFLREKFHVMHIGLFGSFAKGEATDKSDIDFLVVIDADAEHYSTAKRGLREYLQEQFGREVDLANPRYLKPHSKELVLKYAVYA